MKYRYEGLDKDGNDLKGVVEATARNLLSHSPWPLVTEPGLEGVIVDQNK